MSASLRAASPAPWAAVPKKADTLPTTCDAADWAEPAARSTASPTAVGPRSAALSRSMRIDTWANQAAMRASTVAEPRISAPATPA